MDLLEKFKQKNIEDIKLYVTPKVYFDTSCKFYKDVQDGVASDINFFENTLCIFDEVKKPSRKADFISDSGSMYWYTNDGVIRCSNHWGLSVANCDWPLRLSNGEVVYGHTWLYFHKFNENKYGKAKWKDFIFKSYIAEIEGKEVLVGFNNIVGRSTIRHGRYTYQKVVRESYEKI